MNGAFPSIFDIRLRPQNRPGAQAFDILQFFETHHPANQIAFSKESL